MALMQLLCRAAPQEDRNSMFHMIAQALGVSKSTIKRRVQEYAISVGPRVVLDDSELDTLVRDIQREFPNTGYRRIHSQLKSRGVKVTQSRVRESMHDFVEPVRLYKMAVYLLQSENRKVHSVCLPTRL